MAAITTQLGLVTPTQGDLSGTWGDTVNNGITEYTNIAIAGTLTLTGDGAVTLANTTGSNLASNITSTLTGAGTVTAQFAIVKVTGTLTTAKIITAPSYSKTYVVVNAATGSTVSFIRSGQTPAVSIAVGETAFVYYNGTDYVKITGTATAGAAGGSNTQVQFNSSGVLAGSANMTFNGTTLTVNDLTDSSLTSGRVTYAGASGNLVDSANLTFNGSALSVTGTITAAGQLATIFSTNSALQIATSNSNTGALADNNVIAGNGTNNAIMAMKGTNFTTSGIFTANNAYFGGTGTSSTNLYSTAGNINIYPAATLTATFTTTGLGIGTSSPTAKIDAKLSGTSSGTVINIGNATTGEFGGLGVSDGGTYPVELWGSSLSFKTGSSSYASATQKMFLNSSGNLGLGVTPSAWTSGGQFQLADNKAIVSSGAYINLGANWYYDGGYRYISSTTATNYEQNLGSHRWLTAASGTAGNVFTFTQAMTLDASGRLLVGTTATTTSSSQSGEVYSTGAVGFLLTNTTAANYALSVKNEGTSGTRNLINFYEGTGGGTARANVSLDGSNNFSITSTNATIFTTASTERLRIASTGAFGLSGANYGSSGQVLTSGGSGAAPTWTTVSGGGSQWTTTGSDIYYNTGNVIIGSTSTASGAKLVVVPTNTTGSSAYLTVDLTNFVDSNLQMYITGTASTDKRAVMGPTTATSLAFNTANTERMRITSAGDVGIGTTSPQARLHVSDAVAGGQLLVTNNETNNGAKIGSLATMHHQNAEEPVLAISIEGGASENILQIGGGPGEFNASTVIRFFTAANTTTTGGSERARINSTGTVLINSTATTPSGNTSIKLNTVGQIVFAQGSATTGDVAKGYINFLPYGSSTNGSNSEAWADLATGVFIDSQIEAGNTALANTALLIRGQIGGSSSPGALIRAGTGANGSATFNQAFRVLYNGNVANSNGTYGTLSDARAKQDIIDASSQWDDIKAVRVRKYRLISDVERSVETGIEAPYQIGVVAQELQQTSPGLVETNGDESNMMTVKSSIMYMKAIKALQEAMQRIETLETQVAALRAQ